MKPWTGRGHRLSDAVARFIRGDGITDFETLALDLHHWQASNDPIIAAQVEAPVESWRSIPALPVDLFKRLPIGTAVRPTAIFRTSGTTGSGRGEQRLRSTALYDLGAVAWKSHCVPDAPSTIVALLEDPAQVPDSSLSHMVGLFGDASWHVQDGKVTAPRLSNKPVFVAATAFALADWLEQEPSALPSGSVLMVTGGFKGRVHRLEGHALYRAARRDLAPERLVTEYGMTELSSQLWGTPETAYRPPPWLRALAVDPETGRPRGAGVAGQLRFVDLCNLDTTLAIDTLDQGVVHEDGSVTLLGRLPDAPARGCSLTVEEAWLR